jgi:hypothetical protein
MPGAGCSSGSTVTVVAATETAWRSLGDLHFWDDGGLVLSPVDLYRLVGKRRWEGFVSFGFDGIHIPGTNVPYALVTPPRSPVYASDWTRIPSEFEQRDGESDEDYARRVDAILRRQHGGYDNLSPADQAALRRMVQPAWQQQRATPADSECSPVPARTELSDEVLRSRHGGFDQLSPQDQAAVRRMWSRAEPPSE